MSFSTRLRTFAAMSCTVLMIAPNLTWVAHAEILPQFKILGRGIYVEKTQSYLQLACVGEDPTSTEKSCHQVQFIHSSPGAAYEFIGPIFNLSQESDSSHQLLKKEFLEQFENEVKDQHLDAVMGKGTHTYTEFKREFQSSVYAHANDPGAALLVVGFLGTWVLGAVQIAGVTALAGVTGGASLLGTWVAVDGIIALSSIGGAVLRSELFIDDTKNLKAVVARDLRYWQLRAKPVKEEQFRRIMRVLTPDEESWNSPVKNQCSFKQLKIVDYYMSNAWVYLGKEAILPEGASTLELQDKLGSAFRGALREKIDYRPNDPNAFSVSITKVRPKRGGIVIAGGKECMTVTIKDSKDQHFWSDRFCAQRGLGMLKMLRKIPDCGTWSNELSAAEAQIDGVKVTWPGISAHGSKYSIRFSSDDDGVCKKMGYPLGAVSGTKVGTPRTLKNYNFIEIRSDGTSRGYYNGPARLISSIFCRTSK